MGGCPRSKMCRGTISFSAESLLNMCLCVANAGCLLMGTDIDVPLDCVESSGFVGKGQLLFVRSGNGHIGEMASGGGVGMLPICVVSSVLMYD